jgi:hypothetical protein
MIRSLVLIIALCNLTPLLSQVHSDDAPAHVATHKRLPTWQSITHTIAAAWNWITNIFTGMFSKLVIRNIPPFLKELYATRVTREEKYAQTYITQEIPEELARAAGTLDRMEEDYKMCRARLTSDVDPSLERSLLREVDRIDDDVDAYMEQIQPLIEKYDQEAFHKKKMKLFKFLQILQSRSFVVEMLTQ